MEDLSRATELFIAGLKNAHAMESQALAIMRPQVGRIENYPEVKAKLEQHIGETEEQINRLEHVLEDCGTAKSALKDATLSIAGTMAAGKADALEPLKQNLDEELAMAAWLEENLEVLTSKFVTRFAEGETAKK
jgi:ferritin-like metal-binding protein YciE